MASRRFLLVRGVEGIMVPDPWTPPRHGQAARIVGHDLSGDCVLGDEGTCTKHADPDHVLEHYAPADHVIEDHALLQRAIKPVPAGGVGIKGYTPAPALILLDSVTAKNHEAARAAFEAKIKKAPAQTAAKGA